MEVSRGDFVICIDNARINLTINKSYVVLNNLTEDKLQNDFIISMIEVINDNGEYSEYHAHRFVLDVEKNRASVIDGILS